MLNLMVDWDNGSSLNVIIGHDHICKVESKAYRIRSEARRVAATGRSNMFEIAMELGCNAFADFMFTHAKEYGALILTGELPADIEFAAYDR